MNILALHEDFETSKLNLRRKLHGKGIAAGPRLAADEYLDWPEAWLLYFVGSQD